MGENYYLSCLLKLIGIKLRGGGEFGGGGGGGGGCTLYVKKVARRKKEGSTSKLRISRESVLYNYLCINSKALASQT